MRVTAWKTVDVECEVDIDIEEFANEIAERAKEATGMYWRRLLSGMDAITQIMSKIPDDVIKGIPKEARETIAERLAKESARWDTVP